MTNRGFVLILVAALMLVAVEALPRDPLPVPLELTGHASSVLAVAFSPDGSRLASGDGFFNGPSGEIRVWDGLTGEKLWAMSSPAWWCESVAFSPDGRALAVGGAQYVCREQAYCALTHVFDTTTWRLLSTFSGSGALKLSSLAFTPDGTHIVTFEDGRLKFWNIETGYISRSWTSGHGQKKVIFSPNGNYLAVGCDDGTVELWEMSSERVWLSLPGCPHGVFSLAYSPDGALLAAGYFDGTITLWDAKLIGLRLRTMAAHTGLVRSLAFSPDGRLLVSGGGMAPTGELRIWDPTTGTLLLALTSPGGPVYSIAFSPDGYLVATGSEDGVVRIWDVSSLALP